MELALEFDSFEKVRRQKEREHKETKAEDKDTEARDKETQSQSQSQSHSAEHEDEIDTSKEEEQRTHEIGMDHGTAKRESFQIEPINEPNWGKRSKNLQQTNKNQEREVESTLQAKQS